MINLLTIVGITQEAHTSKRSVGGSSSQTGKEPDSRQIAYKEEWASGLVPDDMEGFYLGEDGLLILMDECGNSTCCPLDRFEVL